MRIFGILLVLAASGCSTVSRRMVMDVTATDDGQLKVDQCLVKYKTGNFVLFFFSQYSISECASHNIELTASKAKPGVKASE
jgi:uncharacterized protein YceK